MASVLEQIITGWRESEQEKGGLGLWSEDERQSEQPPNPWLCIPRIISYTLFIYSGVQQVPLWNLLLYGGKTCLNKLSNFSTPSTPLMGRVLKPHHQIPCVHVTCHWFSPRHSWNFNEAWPRRVHIRSIVLCVVRSKVYDRWSHMASSGGSHFVALVYICWSPWILPASRVLWKMRWQQTTGVRTGCLCPGGGNNWSHLLAQMWLKGLGEVIQSFDRGAKGRMTSHSVSAAVSYLTWRVSQAPSARLNTAQVAPLARWHRGSLVLI